MINYFYQNEDLHRKWWLAIEVSVVGMAVSLLAIAIFCLIVTVVGLDPRHFAAPMHSPDLIGYALIPPLVPMLMLLSWIFLQNKKLFLLLTCYFFTIFFLARIFFPGPTHYMDYQYYLDQVGLYHSIADALLNRRLDASPTSGMVYLGLVLFKNLNISVALLHAIYLAALAVMSLKLFKINFLRSGQLQYSFIYLLLALISPLTLILGVMINKDFIIVISLFVLFYAVYSIFKSILEKFSSKEIKQIAYKLVLIFLAGSVLYCARPHLFYTFVIAVFFTAVYVGLRLTRILEGIQTTLVMATALNVLVFILFLKWGAMRHLISQFYGNTAILPLFAMHQPALLQTYLYLVWGLFYGLFGIFINPINLSLTKIFYLMAEQLFFLLAVFFFIRSNVKTILTIFFIIFFMVHLEVQIWATPNIGEIVRQRLFEYFFVGTYAISMFFNKIGMVKD